ncbi:MAG: transposase [Alkalispirochaeta sp.]
MEALQELFTAYQNGTLPKEHGYIVSVFYHNTSTYTRYELISFNNVKDIYMTDEGLLFQAEGRKIYVLVEPAGYPNGHTEPAYRTDSERIPYRKKELIDFVTKRQDHVYVGREPVVTYTSFTVLKSVGQDVSYVFYPHENIRESILEFFRVSLWKQARVPQLDARKVKDTIGEVFAKIEVGEEFK